MRQWLCAAALVCVVAWTVGCTATETGNPVTEQRLSLTAVSSVPEVQVTPDADSEVVIEEAWIVLGDVRFIPGSDCDVGDDAAGRIDIPGPTVVELVAGSEPLTFGLADRGYCRVRLPLERADALPAAAPDALEDHAVVLLGSLADGTPFTLLSRETREAEVRSRTEPFRLGDAEASLLLAFDVGAWLAGVDLGSAVREDDGSIVIDDGDNGDLLDVIEDDMRQALELFRDLDEDGRLDDDERASPLASGG